MLPITADQAPDQTIFTPLGVLVQTLHTCAGAATAHGCVAAGGAAESRPHIHQTGPALQHPQRPAAPRIHRGAGIATGAVSSHRSVTCSRLHVNAFDCGTVQVYEVALGPYSFSCCVPCELHWCGAGSHASRSAMPCRTVCQPSRSAGPGQSSRHSWARRQSNCLRCLMSSRLLLPAWARYARSTC